MPPKDIPDINTGTIYFAQVGGDLVPLGGIQEATLEPAEGGVVDPAIVIGADLVKEATFTATLEMPRDFIQDYIEYHRKFRKDLKKLHRLMHLGWHGKNRRIRKKNWKRAIKLYQSIKP